MKQLIINLSIAVVVMFGTAYLGMKIHFAQTEEDAQRTIFILLVVAFIIGAAVWFGYQIIKEVNSKEPMTRRSIAVIGAQFFMLSMLFTTATWIMLATVVLDLQKDLGRALDIIGKILDRQ